MNEQELNNTLTNLQFVTGRDIPNRLNAIEARLSTLEQNPEFQLLIEGLNDIQTLKIHLNKAISDLKVLNDKIMILTKPIIHASGQTAGPEIKKPWRFW